MATPSVNQAFSSIAGGITDVAPAQASQVSTLADSDPQPTSATTTAPSHTATPDVSVSADASPPARRPVGRPRGSKNKATGITLDFSPPDKRPVGRPRGSGKKRTEPDGTKRPVGRPRKDGLPAGTSTLVPPLQDYYPMTSTPVPISQWVPAYPGSISAPPAPPPSAAVIDPALTRNEWADLAHTKPDQFLHVLLAALDPPCSPFVTGPSVQEAFKSHLGSLAPPPTPSGTTPANGTPSVPTQTIPSLYSILKTFWLPSSPSYFALTASATSARTPAAHRFLYWDPQPLVFNGIACPACAAPFTNRGRIRSGPLTVHDLAGPFFIIGCTYGCANGHEYASTDAAVRRALPAALEREFPARLLAGDAGNGADVWNWQARGVSRALWNLVLGSLRAGLARDVILQLVRDVQHGVPEMDVKEEEQADSMMEEEESAEEAAQGQGDVLMAPTADAAEPTAVSAAQAFNDAWTANSVIASAGGPSAQGGDLRNNPYARLAMSMFPQGFVPPMMAYEDPLQRKRPYPFGELDAGAGMSVSPSNGVGNNGAGAAGGDAGGMSAAAAAGTSKRSPRHCCKCGSQSCKGKGGRTFCTSACMDCGKFDCRGRNSRRPDKKCDSGWPDGQPQGVPGLQDPGPPPL
ncbi:hypothetical protein B0H17DRAFT_1212501 [Mycena rosella]|uniref:Uncharacterized protein n=1 Tax=Mycena rosella TaxID=1033263 RepID=A0AAD7CRL6_MYCRO|nr:hypothetical protein B0H17DRAFT_1212501 [Mycena rosella]